MDYIQLTCKIQSDNVELAREVLTQELSDLGFESFEETAEGLLAYIQAKDYNPVLSDSLPADILGLGTATYTSATIKDKNWNEEWEKNFQPIVIANKCFVRAPFHAKMEGVPYEIVIEPKMAFGTGHHETTSLMIEQMLSLEFKDKQVLDMGCGTGILAIMASMLKAKQILAIDIDEWSYINTRENCEKNSIANVTPMQGDIDLIRKRQFDIILANINRNILLHQIPSYAASLPSGGSLLMSGIYRTDFTVIQEACEKVGFEHVSLIEKNNWIAVLFRKN